jgi:polysaccharide pyruvyl transferase WcaK-like protein
MKLLFLADVSGEVAHIGDEAMLEANLGLFRELLPEAEMVVASGPEWSGGGAGTRTVARLQFSAESERAREALLAAVTAGQSDAGGLFETLRQASLLVISGGGNLSSSWPEHLYERVAMARSAAAAGIPILLIGQTLGPELTRRQRELLKELLQLAAFIGVRETYSYALALEIGAPPDRLHYQCDDAAFLQPSKPSAERLADLPLESPFVAITFHPLGEPSTHNPLIRELAGSLRRLVSATGARLVFIPHVAAASPGGILPDAAFGTALARAMYGNPPMPIGPILPPAEAMWVTQQARLVISSRYHPLVFAQAGNIPSIGLFSDEYTRRKLTGALIHSRVPERAMSLPAAVAGDLVSLATELWESAPVSPSAELPLPSRSSRLAVLRRVVGGLRLPTPA